MTATMSFMIARPRKAKSPRSLAMLAKSPVQARIYTRAEVSLPSQDCSPPMTGRLHSPFTFRRAFGEKSSVKRRSHPLAGRELLPTARPKGAEAAIAGIDQLGPRVD